MYEREGWAIIDESGARGQVGVHRRTRAGAKAA